MYKINYITFWVKHRKDENDVKRKTIRRLKKLNERKK